MATDNELLRLHDLSSGNVKDFQHLANILTKSRETLFNIGHPFPGIYFISEVFGPPYASFASEIHDSDLDSLISRDRLTEAFAEEMSLKRADTTTHPTASAMRIGQPQGQSNQEGPQGSTGPEGTAEQQ